MKDLKAPMTGGDSRAEPYSEKFRELLKTACAEDSEIWRIYAWSYDPEHFDETLDRLISQPANQLFVLFSGEEFAGMSAYLGIDPERQVLEIGNTYYRLHLRGTGFNLRVKDMMLRHAFGCGIRRVEFRVDARNGRSQAAMAKIGAVREGVLRADRITWSGHLRDTVLFSLLADEWPPTAG